MCRLQSNRQSMDKRAQGLAQQDDSRELRRSLDDGSLSNVAGARDKMSQRIFDTANFPALLAVGRAFVRLPGRLRG